jgi:hypothetical protein
MGAFGLSAIVTVLGAGCGDHRLPAGTALGGGA